MRFKLVWFDSYGAKSSCTLVKTKELNLLIDPGVAIMHPSFPASFVKKLKWVSEGKRAIKEAAKQADAIVISHYHWDHFMPKDFKVYEGKLILAKNPNCYINDSQRKRALEFYSFLAKKLGKELKLEKPKIKEFEDPANKLRSTKLDFGDYSRRRNELLAKGKKWFKLRVKRWKSYKQIPEFEAKQTRIRFVEGKEFKFGKTRIRFTPPLFHGIEYSRVGWVFMTVVERGREKLLHSSDLNGPIIEDYADFIIAENPTYLILDGPMTYMLGYTLNLINFRRILKNVERIVRKVNFKLMIWDHHLPREPKFKERTKEIWQLAEELGKRLLTASQWELGREAVVLQFARLRSKPS